MSPCGNGGRCSTNKTRVNASGDVGALVLSDVSRGGGGHFYGDESLFVLVEFLTLLMGRGTAVPGFPRWALKVYDGISSSPSLCVALQFRQLLPEAERPCLGPRYRRRSSTFN